MYSAGNEQKIPLGRALNEWAAQKIAAALELQGWSLPASIVSLPSPGLARVNFEVTNSPYTLPQVVVPIVGSVYQRVPYQVGDLGRVVPSDVSLAAASGQADGTADFMLPVGPLGALCWEPIGNKRWVAADPNVHEIYGPDGVVISTVAKDAFVRVSDGKVTISAASIEFDGTITSTSGNLDIGSLNIRTTGDIQANRIHGSQDVVAQSVSLLSHIHSGVATGTNPTGPPL